ncbi:hypothetical protein AB7M17_007184 [Bradyrhizobium sp. USDA 377]
MATIVTVAFFILVAVAMLAKARLKERAAYRKQMFNNAMRAVAGK